MAVLSNAVHGKLLSAWSRRQGTVKINRLNIAGYHRMTEYENITQPKRKRRKKLVFLILFAAVIITGMLLARGRYVSDALKNVILPELQQASGQKVTAERIYLNLFPLFIEARGLTVTSQEEGKILSVEKVKGYVELPGLFDRNITIRRLAIYQPDISAERTQIEGIVHHIKAYLEKEKKTVFKVKVKVVEIVKGTANLRDNDFHGTVSMRGLAGELILGEYERIKATVKELVLEKEGWPKIECDINTAITVKKEKVEIKHLEIGSHGSRLKTAGIYSREQGSLTTDVALIMDSIKRIFRLGQRGDGRIAAKGVIRLEKSRKEELSLRADRLSPEVRLEAGRKSGFSLQDIFLDLKLSGDFYLQTLMELLEVKDQLEGLVDFRGEIKGRLSDITGTAEARLRKGNLYGVDIDSLKCEVFYHDGEMKFEKGRASLYDGSAEADALIHLPVVDFYTLHVKFRNADSRPILKLIGWEPDIPDGKVEGELSTSGSAFNPDGRFVYRSLSAGQRTRKQGQQQSVEDVLYRIRDIRGNFSLRDGNVSFPSLLITTAVSDLTLNGTVDIPRKQLHFRSRLSAGNISDLVLPYYREVTGRGEFSGELTGHFDNPKISGRADLSRVVIEGYPLHSVTADFAYQKKLLEIRSSSLKAPGQEHSFQGKISFPDAKELFELSMPVYDLKATLRNAELGQTARMFYRNFSGQGRMNADIRIGSRDRKFHMTGKAYLEKASVYKVPFDTASMSLAYANEELSLKGVSVRKGNSNLTGDGSISYDGRFSYRISAEKIFIRDFGLDRMPDDAVVRIRSEGHGTFDNPSIELNATVEGGTFKGRNMGKGIVQALIRNRNITVNAALFNERMKLRGHGYLNDALPWNAELSFQPGRYDFIVSSVLKDVPEDLQLNLEGNVEMKGDRRNISASVRIAHLTLALFGQTLSNDSDIIFQMENRKLSFRAFAVRSGATSFRLEGGMEIGREYDIVMNGSSSLSPLKGLSKKIGYLKGDADFVFAVKGKWEQPEINGGMNLFDASFGLRDYAAYMSSINGYLYIEGDRVVLERLSGKIGGGNITLSGILYLKGFALRKYYLEAKLDNIAPVLDRDFSINFSGDLVYKGTKDAQSITGDIIINRATYRQMVEWRRWLLTAKAIETPKTEVSVLEKAELNIRISGSDHISIDNNIARAPVNIRGDMIVKGTLSNPVLFGRLETKDGYAYFKNNEFRIIYASVDFADPNRIKPVINLTAETDVKGYNITLNLDGEMDQFSLSLSSDPHLEEVDVLALLTVGHVGKELKGLEGGIGAGEATSFLTGEVQDVLEERVRTITGIDRFQVEPSISKTTSTVGPKVTVSERLLGDKLFVTYSTLWGSQVEEVLKVEYLINKNISLIGVRDEKGSIGGDVKLRFRFK